MQTLCINMSAEALLSQREAWPPLIYVRQWKTRGQTGGTLARTADFSSLITEVETSQADWF
jgi:hypothetical protein